MIEQEKRATFARNVLLGMVFFAVTGCATPVQTSIIDARASDVEGCENLGTVSGSNALFVGISASIGRTRAHNDALNEAAHRRATHVVWQERGTSMTNEWVGTAYSCG